ncbi:LysM domain-containing protein [Sorangium sp. So ce131]|uniref:LysM domain-containing protein n=1 Tax=Sorangium sp. So ce131 TaxID=3133282 RepID=UPI003F6377B3
MNSIQDFLSAGLPPTAIFPPQSRYASVGTSTYTAPDGRVIVHLRRRFVPPPEGFGLLQEHVVKQGERLDNVTARYLGDPEQFWRICDANRATRPDALLEAVGSKLRITMPRGMVGPAL